MLKKKCKELFPFFVFPLAYVKFIYLAKINKMKKIPAILIAHTFCGYIFAQTIKTQNVPDAVKAKFTTLYPEVKNVSWEKENNQSEVEFKQNTMEVSVFIDATGILTQTGILIQTETAIPVKSLPHAITYYLAKNLPGKKINEAAKIVNAKGIVTYEAEVGDDDYIFDADGNFLRKELEDSTEDDD